MDHLRVSLVAPTVTPSIRLLEKIQRLWMGGAVALEGWPSMTGLMSRFCFGDESLAVKLMTGEFLFPQARLGFVYKAMTCKFFYVVFVILFLFLSLDLRTSLPFRRGKCVM